VQASILADDEADWNSGTLTNATVALDGAVTHEITRIRLDAPAQPVLFELPAEYPLLTRAQVIERMGDSELDAAALAEKQRRIQDRIEEIEGRDGATTEPPAPPP